MQSGWIKGSGNDATTPLGGKTAVGDVGASILYWSDMERAMGVVAAYFRKQSMMIAVRRQGENSENIYSGVSL